MNRLILSALFPLALSACSASESPASNPGATAQEAANSVSLRVTGMT